MNILSEVSIIDFHIPSSVIFYIFVVLAGAALVLFILNLVFNKSQTVKKRKNGLTEEELAKQEKFEASKTDIETEINLIVRTEKSKKEGQDESETKQR